MVRYIVATLVRQVVRWQSEINVFSFCFLGLLCSLQITHISVCGCFDKPERMRLNNVFLPPSSPIIGKVEGDGFSVLLTHALNTHTIRTHNQMMANRVVD